MGIYIAGMEMPTGENSLLCIISPDGSIEFKLDFEKRWHDGNAIEIPPHGRLIDADALAKDYDGFPVRIDPWVWNELSHAPTIIPAEEGE